jgi:hypothetical protein
MRRVYRIFSKLLDKPLKSLTHQSCIKREQLYDF